MFNRYLQRFGVLLSGLKLPVTYTLKKLRMKLVTITQLKLNCHRHTHLKKNLPICARVILDSVFKYLSNLGRNTANCSKLSHFGNQLHALSTHL